MKTMPDLNLPRILLLLGFLSATALLLVGAALAETDGADPLAAVREAYQRHNYAQAVELSDRLLLTNPPAEQALAAQRLKALSLCRNNGSDGYEYASGLMKSHPQLREDAELWMAMGQDRSNTWPRSDAYRAFVRAAGLYGQEQQFESAADAWFQAAEMLEPDPSLLPEPVLRQAQEENWDWQRRTAEHTAAVLEVYKRIAAMPIDDARKAKALFLGGRHAASQPQWDLAEQGIAMLRRCVREHASQAEAAHAQLYIGLTLGRFSRFVEALEAYRALLENYPTDALADTARDQIRSIEAPVVGVWVEKGYLPGQKPQIYWNIRNIRKVQFTAMPVDLVAAVERMEDMGDPLEAIRAVASAPVAQWSFETPDDGKHQFHSHQPNVEAQATSPIMPPLDKPGAYLVTAVGSNPDGQLDTSHCLVLISPLAAVAKTDAGQVLVFAGDALSGEPAQGAVAAAARGWNSADASLDHATGKADADGLVRLMMDRRDHARWIAAVRHGENQALCAQGVYRWGWWGYNQAHKVYGFTDRPVYRPRQTVHFKQILRAHDSGQYTNLPDRKVRVEVRDPRGEVVYSSDLVTDELGTVEGSLQLAAEPPLGVYQIAVAVDGTTIQPWAAPGNRFRVEEYRKPEFEVTVEPGSSDYRVGEEVTLRIAAQYYFGQPVVGAEVKYEIRKQNYQHQYEWGRPWQWYGEQLLRPAMRGRYWWPRFNEHVASGTAVTDENGHAVVTVQAEPIKNHEDLDLSFVVQAEVADISRRTIVGGGQVKVTHAPFFIYPRPAQAVYGPGDSVEIAIRTEDPNGRGVAGQFEVETWRIERIRKTQVVDGQEKVEFEEKLAQKVFSDTIEIPETGRASVRFVPDMTGQFRTLIRSASHRNGVAVEGSCSYWIAARSGAEAHYAYSDLQIVPAQDQYEVGQTLKVLVNTSRTDGRVLLTGEADNLLFSRVVHVEQNSTLVELPVEETLSPNFTLTATLLGAGQIFRDEKPIIVPPTHRFLKVELSAGEGDKGGGKDNLYQPREKAPIRVKITDQLTGEPVVGQVTLMLVDASVYYIQPEFRLPIEQAFYGTVRPVRVATTDSYAGPASLGLREAKRFSRERAADRLMPLSAPAMAGMAEGDSVMRKGASEAQQQEPLAEAVIREQFRDTVLWAGSVMTDQTGQAELSAELPDQLTTFALHAVAVDRDTRVGQAQIDLVTTKRIIVRFATGRFLTEGDRAYVTLIAHNYYDQPQQLTIDLTADDALELLQARHEGTWVNYEGGQGLEVTVPAGGEYRMDFRTTALRPGDVVLTGRARGHRESDATRLTLPILPWGASRLVSDGGSLRRTAIDSLTALTLPEEIKAGSQSLTVTLSPSIAALAMEALPYLAEYPYGCVEQTMSRFLPAVLVRKTLQDSGVELDEIRRHIEKQSAEDPKLAARWQFLQERMGRNPVYSSQEMQKMIDVGMGRLVQMQHEDGSWGWWKRDSGDPYMTAYVLAGLDLARGADAAVPEGMIEKAASWLIRQARVPKAPEDAPWWRRHSDNDNTRIFMLYAISRVQPSALDDETLGEDSLRGHLKRIYEARDDLSDYGRALLALVLHAADMRKEAGIVVENLENTVTISIGRDSARWGEPSGWWYWYEGADETTAWVLQAMLTVNPRNRYVPMAVNYLVHSRRGLWWHNTKSTAMAVYALMRFARTTGELDPDMVVEVRVDDQSVYRARITRDNLFSFQDRLVLGPEQLPPGEHLVRVTRSGQGSIYWGAHLRYHDTSEQIQGGGTRIAVRRSYYRVTQEPFTNTRNVWRDGQWTAEEFPDTRYKRSEPLEFGAELASGDVIEVQLDLTCEQNLEYMIFEDPKPAGCEPLELRSGPTWESGIYANTELRDTKVAFFAAWLKEGENRILYRLRCEQPGTFRILPSSAEAMYTPFIEAISDSGLLTITE